MANVKFAYGTTVPKTSTTGFDDGCIYFNTSTRNIYLRQGSSVYTFDGNNTIYTSDSFPQLDNITSTFVDGNMMIYQGGADYNYEGNSNKPIQGIVTGYSFSQNVTSVNATFDVSEGYTDLKIYYKSNTRPIGWMSNSAPFSLVVYYIPTQS